MLAPCRIVAVAVALSVLAVEAKRGEELRMSEVPFERMSESCSVLVLKDVLPLDSVCCKSVDIAGMTLGASIKPCGCNNVGRTPEVLDNTEVAFGRVLRACEVESSTEGVSSIESVLLMESVLLVESVLIAVIREGVGPAEGLLRFARKDAELGEIGKFTEGECGEMIGLIGGHSALRVS